MRDDFTTSVEAAAAVERGRGDGPAPWVDGPTHDDLNEPAPPLPPRAPRCLPGYHAGVRHPEGYVQCRVCFAVQAGRGGELPSF